MTAVEQNGIVFIDEIDKVAARAETRGADVSREGVQRDLLPLIEGTTVSTKHGPVQTDHILFIASGAFHIAKPSDLLPELHSNFDHAETARHILQRDGATGYFERIVISDEHGWRKPHPRIFTDTLATLGVDPQDALFVGDSPDDDIRGASGVGMDVAWVNAQGRSSTRRVSSTAIRCTCDSRTASGSALFELRIGGASYGTKTTDCCCWR